MYPLVAVQEQRADPDKKGTPFPVAGGADDHVFPLSYSRYLRKRDVGTTHYLGIN